MTTPDVNVPVKALLDAGTDQALASARDRRKALESAGVVFTVSPAITEMLAAQFPDDRHFAARVVMAAAQAASSVLSALQAAGSPVPLTPGTILGHLSFAAEQLAREAGEPQAPGSAAAAVSRFAAIWGDLLTTLPDEYGCHLTCAEAEAAAGLYRALGDEDTAESVIAAHARYDEEGDEHYDEITTTAGEDPAACQ